MPNEQFDRSDGDGASVSAARCLLRVKNLPGVISLDAVTALLSHYGAAEVKLLKDPVTAVRAKRAPQTAIATFRDSAARASALARLNKLELAGHVLHAKAIGDAATQSRDVEQQLLPPEQEADDMQSAQPPLPPGPPPPLPPAPPAAPGAALGNSSYYTPAPLAPHLGLHFAPSPLLEYKYPRASEPIVRNIANALMALPKFYTQVLHLMNKMNLPPPFEANAIAGVFSKDREAKPAAAASQLPLKRRLPGDQRPSVFTVEEEDDDDDDGQEGAASSEADRDAQPPVRDTRKKLRTDTDTGTIHPPLTVATATATPTPDAPASAPSQSATRVAAGPLASVSTHSSRPKTLASGVIKAFSEASSDQSHAARPGVISQHELARRKVPLDELLRCEAMRDYECGAPSRTLVVRNLAATVDEQDLVFVFGCVVPASMELSSALQIVVSHAPTRTATVTYPTQGLAAEALAQIHGVALESLPLIVSYAGDDSTGDAARSAPDAPDRGDAGKSTCARTLSMQELNARRLDASALAAERFMKSYERGEASPTLYVKNLARHVELRELLAVFGAALPQDTSLSTIKIRHFTEGRMKCQAFVEFPSAELAMAALTMSHGVVVQGKPLIVCFRKSPGAAGSRQAAPTVADAPLAALNTENEVAE